MPEFVPMKNDRSNIYFSIIIAARNEEAFVNELLESILKQNYPPNQFEIILVDDHSNDSTVQIVEKFEQVRLIRLNDDYINSYKKKAIETGINEAKNEWIVCTDADCVVPENWLKTIAAYISLYNPVFIAAPVVLTNSKTKMTGLLGIFQILDFLTLQGITAASVYKKIHSMCNGANLAYKKDVFFEVNGFSGIDNIASGDDMLLMHKIWKLYPNKVGYLKATQAIVQTAVAPTWKEFLNQRIRWASKATAYDDKRILVVLSLVYLYNLSFLVLFIGSFFELSYLYVLITSLALKMFVEWLFAAPVSEFFGSKKFMKYFVLFQPLHIAYTITAGFLGTFGKYEWKGRVVK